MNLNQLFTKLKNSENNQIEYYDQGKKCVKKFRDVYSDVIKVTALLHSLGVRKGDRIGILGKNSYEWIIIDLACITHGIITLPLETNKKYDLAWLLSNFNLKFVVTNTADFESEENAVYTFDWIMENAFKVEYDSELVREPYTDDDPFTIISTSGTSGNSKYIEVTKRSFDHLVSRTHAMFEFSSEDRFLVFLPLNIYLERCYVYSAILLDFNIILTPLEYIFHSIQNDRPSVIIGIPYFFENFHNIFLERINANILYRMAFGGYLLLKRSGLGFLVGNRFKPFVKAWGGNIRYLLTGAAPIRRKTLDFFNEMGIVLYEGYGMSEVGGMIALNSPGSYKIGSVGKPFPDKQVTIDTTGQILVKSKFNANTSYYRSTAEENSKTYLQDGSVATGDLGYFDKDGFLYINGRAKDLIVTSTGKKIHPTYIEEHVINTGVFNNCVVYGDNRPFVVALVVPKNDEIDEPTIKEKISHVNSKLNADEKILNYIVVKEKFTTENKLLTNTLKVNRRTIYEKFRNEITKLYN